MRTIFIFLLISLSSSFGNELSQLHSWTDLNGRNLEAKFIQANDTSVTIEWNGNRFDLPIITLNEESKILLQKLKGQAEEAPKNESNLHEWKDTSGRTIQASFVKSDKLTVTLNWNGKISVLPLSMFDDASRQLAIRLQVASQSPQKLPTTGGGEKVDLNGNLKLAQEYPWRNQGGQSVLGQFVELTKDELKISMNGGSREVVIPLATLSPDSLSLAKKINILSAQAQKATAVLIKKRKSLKVPKVTDADLEIEHEFKNVKGQVIMAQFSDADERLVSLIMKSRSSRPIALAWESFDSESMAKLEALRRKKAELASRKPKIIPAKGARLSYYGSGKYKNYNTIFEGDSYTIGLPYSGDGLHVWINPSADKLPESAQSTPLGIKRMSIGFNSRFVDKSNPKRSRTRSRRITSFDSSPEPSLDREKIMLTGKYENGGTFEYNMEVNRKGMQFWSRIKDPAGEEWPTSTRVSVSLHGVVPNVKDLAMAKIKSQIGDGAFYMTPVEGKRIKLPFDKKWTELKIPRGALSSLKAVEVMGFPYYQFKFNISPNNGKDMNFNYEKGYAGTFPFQGISLRYSSKEKRTEVPRSRSLKVSVTRN